MSRSKQTQPPPPTRLPSHLSSAGQLLFPHRLPEDLLSSFCLLCCLACLFFFLLLSRREESFEFCGKKIKRVMLGTTPFKGGGAITKK